MPWELSTEKQERQGLCCILLPLQVARQLLAAHPDCAQTAPLLASSKDAKGDAPAFNNGDGAVRGRDCATGSQHH